MSQLSIGQLPLGPQSSASPLHASMTHPEPSQPFRFMDLPAELRNMIYAYLLPTKHTKIEDSSNPWHPTISVNFQTAILEVTPQIKQEAEYILCRENLLVSVTSNLIICEQWWVFAEPVVTMRDEEAKAFKSHSLAIELDFRYYSTIFREESRVLEWDEPSHFLVACEDLSQLVRELLIINHTITGVGIPLLTEYHLEIDVLGPLDSGASDKSQTSISDATRLQTFSEAFHRLHSVASPIITGSADIEYMNDIITSVSAPQIDAHVLIYMAIAIEERGDDLVRRGDYLEAFSTYVAALNGLQHGCLLPGQTWTVDGGAFA